MEEFFEPLYPCQCQRGSKGQYRPNKDKINNRERVAGW